MSTIAERKAQARAMWEASRWEDVAIFIGPNAEAFRRTWERCRTAGIAGKSPLKWSWNLPALLFQCIWWAYRRQWWIAGLLLGIPIVIANIVPSSGSGLAGAEVAIALMANSTYIQIAVAKITKVRAAGGNIGEIAAAGGVSRPAAIVGGILLAAVVVATIARLLTARI